MASELAGTWYVVRTTLPFWRKRTDPAISFTPLPNGRMTDTVTYRRNGSIGQVIGLDTPTDDGHWEWRGVGALTRLTTSRWRVVEHREPWLVIAFANTLYTPAGADLLARDPDAAVVPEWEARVRRLPEAAGAELFAPRHG